MARVVLINPPFLVSRWAYAGTLTPPLGLAYVAAACREAGHEVRVIDALGEDPLASHAVLGDKLLAHGLTVDEIVERIPADTEVIGLTCMFSAMWPHVREIAERVRERFGDALIVLGGEHATAMPEFVLDDAPSIDLCVLGEGEETIVELLAVRYGREGGEGRERSEGGPGEGGDLSAVAGLALRDADSTPFRTGKRARIGEIDAICVPAWDLVPVERYMDLGLNMGVNRGRSMPVLASRGCPFQCTFCSSPQMWTTRWNARDPDVLLDEIEGYMRRYGATNFDFYDLTAIVNRKWILRFTERIRERGLRFTWQMPSGTRSEAIDAEVAEQLGLAGCSNISYSPESGSADLLRRVKKKVDLDSIRDSMRSSARAGLSVKANIIMGLPSETHADLRATLGLISWCARNGVDDLSIAPYTPYPGSELFDELAAGGGVDLLDDAYFISLNMQNELGTARSWSDLIDARTLGRYRSFGHALFYIVAFARRPQRMFALARNAVRGTEESVLDKVLRGFLRRQFQWARLRARRDH